MCIRDSNGEDYFDKLNLISKEQYPHVVLMDLEMPILDGIVTCLLYTSRCV